MTTYTTGEMLEKSLMHGDVYEAVSTNDKDYFTNGRLYIVDDTCTLSDNDDDELSVKHHYDCEFLFIGSAFDTPSNKVTEALDEILAISSYYPHNHEEAIATLEDVARLASDGLTKE